MEISQNAMARAIGVPPRAVNEIVLGGRAITPHHVDPLRRLLRPDARVLARNPGRVRFPCLAKKQKQLTAKIRPATELSHAA